MLKIFNFIKKTWGILKEEGIIALIGRVLPTCSMVDLWKNDLKDQRIDLRSNDTQINIITDVDELRNLLSDGYNLSWYEMTREQCYGRLKRGAIMFLALTGKDIIHVSWVGTNESSHNEFYFSPVDFKHEASIGGTMTYPKYRGKNINALVYSRIFLYLKNKSYKPR